MVIPRGAPRAALLAWLATAASSSACLGPLAPGPPDAAADAAAPDTRAPDLAASRPDVAPAPEVGAADATSLRDAAPDGDDAVDARVSDAGTPTCPASPPSVTVWLVGDSTVAGGTGWGEAFRSYLLPAARVENRARGGASSRSYYEAADSYWSRSANAVLRGMRPGDYVLVQFGHNDGYPDAARHTDPGAAPAYRASYREYLERYINEARTRGAVPIIVTPVSQMVWVDGRLTVPLGSYPPAARRTAADNGVATLDLFQRSHDTFAALGEAATLEQYARLPDRVHFPPEKAWRVALMVASLLRASPSPLRCWLVP